MQLNTVAVLYFSNFLVTPIPSQWSRPVVKSKFLFLQAATAMQIYRLELEIQKYFKLSRGNVNRITTVNEYTTVRETKIERELGKLARNQK